MRWLSRIFDRRGFTGAQRLEIADLIRVGLECHDMRRETRLMSSLIAQMEIDDMGCSHRPSASVVPFPANDRHSEPPSPAA